MKSSPLRSTHSRTTSGVSFHHSTWMANNVERCRAWHDITALGQHSRSYDVGLGMTTPPLDITDGGQRRVWHDITTLRQNTLSNDVGRGMPSSHLGSTHGRTTSGVACHHHLWDAQTVERRRTWHEITALGLHRRSDDVRCGMTSLPLDSTHGRRVWHDITAL